MRRRYHVDAVPPFGRLLDVGCARGMWMALQRRLGFRCAGCEPDDVAAAAARELGFDVFTGDLLEARYPPASFDSVHFSHVLEHTHDPMAVLTEACRVVKPGGTVVVVVPNRDGLADASFRCLEDVPRYLFAFTTRNLSDYYAACGLTLREAYTETTHVPDLFGPFAEASRRCLEMQGRSTDTADAFWRSAKRLREFSPTVKLADSIGAGVSLVAVGQRLQAMG